MNLLDKTANIATCKRSHDFQWNIVSAGFISAKGAGRAAEQEMGGWGRVQGSKTTGGINPVFRDRDVRREEARVSSSNGRRIRQTGARYPHAISFPRTAYRNGIDVYRAAFFFFFFSFSRPTNGRRVDARYVHTNV